MGTMENYWQLGRWGGVRVAMHWTVLIVFAWLYFLVGGLLATLVASGAFLALLVVHELGHVAVLRRRKIAVESVTFYGIHGTTAHGYARPLDEIAVAWGGVAAQLAVLVLALAAGYFLDSVTGAWVAAIASPVLFVFTKVNLFLVIVALLPIGPFDGQAAWKVIPWMRAKAKRRKVSPKPAPRVMPLEPEPVLTAEAQRELEASSEKAAAELMEKLARKK